MTQWSPDQIVAAIFNEGAWKTRNPGITTLREGLQNLSFLGFSADQIAEQREALELCALILIADKYIHNKPDRIPAEEPGNWRGVMLPVDFNFARGMEFELDAEADFEVADSREDLLKALRASYLNELHLVQAQQEQNRIIEERRKNGGLTLISSIPVIQ